MIMNETIAELEARLYDAEVKVKVGGHSISSSSSSDYDDEAVVVPAVDAPKLTPDYPSSSSSSSSMGKSSPEHQELVSNLRDLELVSTNLKNVDHKSFIFIETLFIPIFTTGFPEPFRVLSSPACLRFFARFEILIKIEV